MLALIVELPSSFMYRPSAILWDTSWSVVAVVGYPEYIAGKLNPMF